jgi:hypothetical protein
MAMGMVYWPAEWPQLEDALRQLLSFPGKEDDLIAACAILGMGLDKMVRPEGNQPSNLPKKGTMAYLGFGQADRNAPKGWSS